MIAAKQTLARGEELGLGEASTLETSEAARVPPRELILRLVVSQRTCVQLAQESGGAQSAAAVVIGKTDERIELVVRDWRLHVASHATFKGGEIVSKNCLRLRLGQGSRARTCNTVNSVLRQIVGAGLTGVTVTNGPNTDAILVAST